MGGAGELGIPTGWGAGESVTDQPSRSPGVNEPEKWTKGSGQPGTSKCWSATVEAELVGESMVGLGSLLVSELAVRKNCSRE